LQNPEIFYSQSLSALALFVVPGTEIPAYLSGVPDPIA
jgi:hypothetical protein